MSIAILCVLIASILPIVFVAYAKFGGGFKVGQHNAHPREYLAALEGKFYRARCAHDNSWEAFAPFAAAVILALHQGVTSSTVDILAVVFIVARIFYGISYIANWAMTRSVIFFISWGTTVTLFLLAAFK